MVLNGCKCKTGCSTRRCKCNKSSKRCGPGCRCIGCSNGPTTQAPTRPELHDLEVEDQLNQHSADEGFTDESEDDLDPPDICEDVEDIMTSVFGEEFDSDD